MAEHPIVQVLRKDREKEDTEATATLKDYHTTITYVGAGALGFFLTIHDKFFHLQESHLFWLFVTSLILLFLSLILYLVHIVTAFFSHSGLRNQMDTYITTVDFASASQEQKDEAENKLLEKWQRGEKLSRGLMFARLALLMIGIAAEITFIAMNIHGNHGLNESPAVRIDVQKAPAGTNIVVDTSAKGSIQIKFQNQ